MLTQSDLKLFPNFAPHELDSKDKDGSGKGTWVNMDLLFMTRLQALRMILGKPLNPTSAYRTPSHNKAIGGSPRSGHLFGKAVDIARIHPITKKVLLTKEDCRKLVHYARLLGFTGVGIANSFIHIDMMPRVAAWRYTRSGMERVDVGSENEWI